MITWNNLDTLTSYQELEKAARVNLAEAMTGDKGAERVKKYSVPMAEGLVYYYAAKQVDDTVLDALKKLADEAQLAEKFKALYNGEVINTGEKRLVLHHMTRGQLGDAVTADGVDKRTFYKQQQERIAEFANKVHNGEITNAAGEKFTTVVQIGIGGSDLGPRAMYLALENWAKKNGTFKMEAKFISNVDPDDAAAVLYGIDVAHSIFVLVSKSGTTLETLTNESFVKDALKNAGLDASKHMIAVTSETSPLAKSSDYLAAFFMDDYIGGRYSSTSAVGGAVLSLAFGPEAGYLTGALAAILSNFLFGQGPWTPWQMFCWGLIGFLTGVFNRMGMFGPVGQENANDHGRRRHSITLSVFGMAMGFLYGWIMNLFYITGYIRPVNWHTVAAAYVSSFFFELGHGTCTAMVLWLVGEAWVRKLLRIKKKFGLTGEARRYELPPSRFGPEGEP